MSTNKESKKYLSVVTYCIALICLLLGFFLPIFNGKELLFMALPDAFCTTFGIDGNTLGDAFSRMYPIIFTGTKTTVDFAAVAITAYALITAIGVSYLLQSFAQILFGSATKFVEIATFEKKLQLGAVSIDIPTIITLVCSAAVMAALSIFVKYSKTGRAMIAVSEDKGAAQLMGINVNTIIMITFAIGSALAALAGVFTLLKSPAITPTFGAMPGIKAFTAAVIGGIGSIPGAMVGGLLLGIIETFSNAVPALSPYTDAVEFSILIIVLLVKPTGLLGKKRREKV